LVVPAYFSSPRANFDRSIRESYGRMPSVAVQIGGGRV
jgi:hypothetical protein